MPGAIPAPATSPSATSMPMGQFIGGNAATGYSPPQLAATPMQGYGKWVSPDAQFISGLTAGSNLVGNLQAAHRGSTQYAQMQQLAGAMEKVQGDLTPAQIHQIINAGNQLPGTTMIENAAHDIGQGAAGVYHDVAGMFAGGGVVDAGIVPASTQGQMPPGWAPGIGTRAYAGGGAVGAGPVAAAGGAPGGAPMMMPMPMPALPQGAGSNGGVAAGTQLGGTVGAGGGSTAHGAPSVPFPAPAAGLPTPTVEPLAPPQMPPVQLPNIQVSAHQSLIQRGEAWAAHVLHLGMSAHAHAAAAAQQNPNAPAAGSLATAGGPKSVTPQWFKQSDQLIAQAAMHAGLAGLNPMAVTQGLQMQRTTYLQSHFLMGLQATYSALLSGDKAGAAKAFQHAMYFIPHEGTATIHYGPNGQLSVRDPLEPWVLDKNGQPTSQPNLMTLTPGNLSMIGMQATDPEHFGAFIANLSIARMNAQAKLETGEGQYARGVGIEKSGEAAQNRSIADRQRVGAQNTANIAQAHYWDARTQQIEQNYGQNPQAAANVRAALQIAKALTIGVQQTVTPQQANPATGLTQGKLIYDSSKVRSWMRNLSPSEMGQFQGYVAGLAARGMSAQDAALFGQFVMKIINQTHPANKDKSAYAKQAKGGQVPDVLINSQTGVMHVWTGSSWTNLPYDPSALRLAQPTRGAGGMGAGPYPQRPAGSSRGYRTPTAVLDLEGGGASGSAP